MNEKQIQELLDLLFKKKFTKTYKFDGSSYENEVIDEDARTIVENMIRNFNREKINEKIGELEAKVFAYEQIIAKSNFKSFLEK